MPLQVSAREVTNSQVPPDVNPTSKNINHVKTGTILFLWLPTTQVSHAPTISSCALMHLMLYTRGRKYMMHLIKSDVQIQYPQYWIDQKRTGVNMTTIIRTRRIYGIMRNKNIQKFQWKSTRYHNNIDTKQTYRLTWQNRVMTLRKIQSCVSLLVLIHR